MDEGTTSIHFKPTFCFHMSDASNNLTGSLLLVSSLVGIVAGCKQMLTWFKHIKNAEARRKPSSHPNIVFFLAFGNSVACTNLIFIAVGVFLLHKFHSEDSSDGRIPFSMAGWIVPVEGLVSFGFLLSGCFTLVYLIDVCIQLCRKKSLIRAYHGVVWLISISALAVALVLRYRHKDLRRCRTHEEIVPLVVCWLCFLVGLIMASISALFVFDRQVKATLYRMGNSYTRHQRKLLLKIRLKFALLVVIFVACWTPTIILGFFFLFGVGHKGLKALSFLEVTLNPLQAGLNYFIFIPWSNARSVLPPLSERTALNSNNIQETFGGSVGSSLLGSIRIRSPIRGRTVSTSSQFHFTPCPNDCDENGPLLRKETASDISGSQTATTDSELEDNSIVIGTLLGEGTLAIEK